MRTSNAFITALCFGLFLWMVEAGSVLAGEGKDAAWGRVTEDERAIKRCTGRTRDTPP